MLKLIATRPSANFSKSEPYVSAYKENRNNVSSLNLQAHFENNEPIECRHLSTQFVYDALADQESTGKVNYSNYHTTDAIRAHVSLDTEKQFNHLIGAGEKSIVSKDTFSIYVEEQFRNMDADKSHINVFLVVTTDHAMAMILRRKEKQDAQGKRVTVDVVKVYDPNLTDTVARCAKSIDGIDQIEKFEGRLENFLAPNLVNLYFAKDPEHIVLMVKVTPETFNLSAERSTRLAQNTQCSLPLSPISMYYLLRFNIAGELLDMRDRISNASPPLEKKFLYDLLMAKNNKDCPGLFVALARGHGEAIKAYVEVLRLVSEDQRLDLLMADDGDGNTGLFAALCSGHGEAVKAYAEVLRLVSEDQRLKLLMAKNNKDCPGLFVALARGHGEAVKAYVEVLRLVSEDQRLKLLMEKDSQGRSGLFAALCNGHGEAVKAYDELLTLVSEDQRAELIARANLAQLQS